MVTFTLAPITYTVDQQVITYDEARVERHIYSMQLKHGEEYLFRSEIEFARVYLFFALDGVLYIKVETAFPNVYADLESYLKDEFPLAHVGCFMNPDVIRPHLN
jgi:hypothetical protein